MIKVAIILGSEINKKGFGSPSLYRGAAVRPPLYPLILLFFFKKDGLGDREGPARGGGSQTAATRYTLARSKGLIENNPQTLLPINWKSAETPPCNIRYMKNTSQLTNHHNTLIYL